VCGRQFCHPHVWSASSARVCLWSACDNLPLWLAFDNLFVWFILQVTCFFEKEVSSIPHRSPAAPVADDARLDELDENFSDTDTEDEWSSGPERQELSTAV